MACKTKKDCKTTQKKGAPRKKINSTEFVLYAPEAKEVFLAGDFNDWNPEKFAMRKFKNGNCKKKVKLKPGRYEYQFIVDGDWWLDPENDNRSTTPYGSENSVIDIGNEVIS